MSEETIRSKGTAVEEFRRYRTCFEIIADCLTNDGIKFLEANDLADFRLFQVRCDFERCEFLVEYCLGCQGSLRLNFSDEFAHLRRKLITHLDDHLDEWDDVTGPHRSSHDWLEFEAKRVRKEEWLADEGGECAIGSTEEFGRYRRYFENNASDLSDEAFHFLRANGFSDCSFFRVVCDLWSCHYEVTLRLGSERTFRLNFATEFEELRYQMITQIDNQLDEWDMRTGSSRNPHEWDGYERRRVRIEKWFAGGVA